MLYPVRWHLNCWQCHVVAMSPSLRRGLDGDWDWSPGPEASFNEGELATAITVIIIIINR